MTTQTDKIIIINAYDNNGYTLDRYTVSGLLESGESFVIATNACMSIWSVSDHYLNPEEVTGDDKNIGEEIDYFDLPKAIQNEIEAMYGDY